MTNYTPGPWKTDIRSGIAVVYFGPENTESCIDGIPNNRRLAEFHGEYHEDIACWTLGPCDEGNAYLIAAAPDLLEACKWALAAEKALPKGIRHPELEKALENSIAKAEGKS